MRRFTALLLAALMLLSLAACGQGASAGGSAQMPPETRLRKRRPRSCRSRNPMRFQTPRSCRRAAFGTVSLRGRHDGIVEHLFFHPVVAYPELAFDGDAQANGIDDYMVTVDEYNKSSRVRLAMTVDAGSFEELDHDLSVNNYLNFPGYDEKLERARRRSGERHAVITGIASIGGCYTALFIMDADFMMGSMGSVVGRKFAVCLSVLPSLGFRLSALPFLVVHVCKRA